MKRPLWKPLRGPMAVPQPFPASDSEVSGPAYIYQDYPVRPDHVISIGDSVALGTGASTNLVNQIDGNYPLPGTPSKSQWAVGGSTSTEMLTKLLATDLPAASAYSDSQCWHGFTGGNDLTPLFSSSAPASAVASACATIRDNMSAAAAAIKAQHGSGAWVFFNTQFDPTDGGAAPHPLLGDLSAYESTILAHNEALKERALLEGFGIVDMHTMFFGHGLSGDLTNWYDANYFHPNTAGQLGMWYRVRDNIWGPLPW